MKDKHCQYVGGYIHNEIKKSGTIQNSVIFLGYAGAFRKATTQSMTVRQC